MIASKDAEVAICIWKFASFDVLDPSPVDTQRNVVLFFAGNGAGMAANAPVVINDKAVAHERTMLSLKAENK